MDQRVTCCVAGGGPAGAPAEQHYEVCPIEVLRTQPAVSDVARILANGMINTSRALNWADFG